MWVKKETEFADFCEARVARFMSKSYAPYYNLVVYSNFEVYQSKQRGQRQRQKRTKTKDLDKTLRTTYLAHYLLKQLKEKQTGESFTKKESYN